HLTTIVELEFSFEASIVNLRIFDNVSSNAHFVLITNAAERTKKRRPEDRLNHWASRRMAIVSPNVSSLEGENQVGNRKEQLASRQTVLRCSAISPKVIELEVAEGQSKKVMELTKWWITEWIRDPNLLHRMVLRSTFLATINTLLNSYFQVRKLRTKFRENISFSWKICRFPFLRNWKVVVANATLPSCFWLARERYFKTKITDLMVCGYWIAMGSARESEP
ncbi:hypothetical protein H5410_027554, partial [Solanum commersonii]